MDYTMRNIIDQTAARYLDAKMNQAMYFATSENTDAAYHDGVANGILELFGAIYPEHKDELIETINRKRV